MGRGSRAAGLISLSPQSKPSWLTTSTSKTRQDQELHVVTSHNLGGKWYITSNISPVEVAGIYRRFDDSGSTID